MKCATGILLLFLLCCDIPAQDTIVWYRLDFPPASFVEDTGMASGYFDKSMKFIIDHLSQYIHEIKHSDVKRVLHLLEQGEKVATNQLLNTPVRREFIHYTITSQLTFPNHLVILESDYSKFAPYINSKGKISLDRLIRESTMILGRPPTRSYSHEIDSILLKNVQNKRIVTRTGKENLEGLLKMMILRRIDYIIEYPEVAFYKIRDCNIAESFITLPIEGMPPYLELQFALPKNEWGEKIASEINEILWKYRHTPEYIEIYERWLNSDSKERYRGYIRGFYYADTTSEE